MNRKSNQNHNAFIAKNREPSASLASPAQSSSSSSAAAGNDDEPIKWEKRPGGMLVQKRAGKTESPASILHLKIVFGAARLEIPISSQSTFGKKNVLVLNFGFIDLKKQRSEDFWETGELKRRLTAEIGLATAEQRLIYRGKERENGEYLEVCGVKNRSKVEVMEDPASIERRYEEIKRNAKIQRAHRAISDVSMEVDYLADQASEIEESVSNGVKVPEIQINTLMEKLMIQAIKLDSIVAEGNASTQKILQGKRVQKCVEMLDVLTVTNARGKVVKPLIVTTKWETFDPHPSTNNHWTPLIDL